MRTYSIRHALAMAVGVACIAAETTINITHVLAPGHDWWLQPAVIAVGIAGIAQATLAKISTAAFSERRWFIGLMTFVSLVVAIAFSFSTTYKRIAEVAQDRRIDRDASANGNGRAMDARIKALTADVAAECVTVGTRCRELRAELRDVKAARALIGDIVDTNVLGAFSMVPELALPLLLVLAGLSLVAYGEAPSEDDSRQTSFPADDPLPGKEMFEPIAAAPPVDTDERLAKVADFRDQYRARHGRDPSVRTIAKATTIPPTSVHRALKRRAG